MLNIHKIEARDLPDLWFQAVSDVLRIGRQFTIDKGSFEGQTRLEYDYFIGHVKYPGTRPMLPDIPPHLGIPNPVDEGYVFGGEGYDRSYVEYVMSDRKEPGESYTYGERLTRSRIDDDKLFWRAKGNKNMVDLRRVDDKVLYRMLNQDIFLNQIEWIIDTYKKHGHRNNQMVLQVAEPTDLILKDPPCLRHIDTRIQDNKLHFFVYFRSWDLWSGLPANLAGVQVLKEYMAQAIGVEDGEMVLESKGLHLYGYAEKLAKIRCMVEE
ncbi:MAG: thymidylate synthase [Anaerolineae bacterium]